MLDQEQRQESAYCTNCCVAHDVNNIIAAVIGYIELAKVNLSDSAMAMKNLDKAIDAADRAKVLLRQVLSSNHEMQSYHEMQSGNSMQELEPAVREAINMVWSILQGNVEIQCNIGIEGAVSLSTEQIIRIAMNLCTNAIQAMEPDGGELSISLEKASVPKDYMVIHVSDTGKGMSEEIIDGIFNPYFTTRKQGTGLGLTVVDKLARSAGGFIRINSKEGEGSTFSVYLPNHTPKLKKLFSSAECPNTAGKNQQKILFVDDEHCILDLAKTVMEDQGYTVVVADNGQNALDMFLNEPDKFSIVVSDLVMSGLNGDELASPIREIRPDLPMIICSGYCDNNIRKRLCKNGVWKVIKKPYLMKSLSRDIQEVLAR